MGGTSSKPPPIVNVQPYPAAGDNVTGFSPDKQAGGCNNCSISIPPGVSTSSVRLTRGAADEGAITGAQCADLYSDVEKLRESKMSILDFKAKLRRGKYFRATDNPAYCEQLRLPPEISYKITDYKSVVDNLGSLQGVRSFFVTDSGFSGSTKVTITPNIPFRIKVNGREVNVPKMTIYHPSPIRIGNVQHDAVMTLNDPADERASHVILIPIKSDPFGDRKATFFSNFAPYLSGLLEPDPEYGEFDPVDVPTGSTWNLTSLLPVKPNAQTKESEVVGGFYVWEGMPSYRLVLKSKTAQATAQGPQDVYTYGWEQTTKSPMYIALETPVPISPSDLMAIRRLPVTPADQALHPIKPNYLYKPGPPPPEDCNQVRDAPVDVTGLFAKESFESGDAADATDIDKRCDPFEIAKANPPKKGLTQDKVIEIVLSIFAAIAAFIGIYFAVKWARSDTGDYFKRLGEYIGKAFGGAQRLAKAAIAKQKQAIEEVREQVAEKPEPLTESKPEADEARLASALEKESPLRQAAEGKAVEMGSRPSKTSEEGRRTTARRGLASYKPSRRLTQRRRLPDVEPRAPTEDAKPKTKTSIKIGNRDLRIGDKVIINRKKHPKGVVRSNGQRGGVGEETYKCLGTARYGDVGTITNIDPNDPNGLTVDVRCDQKNPKERTGAWYRLDDLLPAFDNEEMTTEQEKKAIEEEPMSEEEVNETMRQLEAQALREQTPAGTGLLTPAEMERGDVQRRALQRMFEERLAGIERENSPDKYQAIREIERTMREEGLEVPKRPVKKRNIAMEEEEPEPAPKTSLGPITQRLISSADARERLRKSEEALRAVRRPATQSNMPAVLRQSLAAQEARRLRGQGKRRRDRRRTVH